MYFALSKSVQVVMRVSSHCINPLLRKACLDILEGKLKANVFRYHEALVMQCLKTLLGYERLLADFGHPLQGSLLAMSTVLPPREIVDLS